jgi:hypothetical protein
MVVICRIPGREVTQAQEEVFAKASAHVNVQPEVGAVGGGAPVGDVLCNVIAQICSNAARRATGKLVLEMLGYRDA